MTGSAVALFTQLHYKHIDKALHRSVTEQWEVFNLCTALDQSIIKQSA